MSNLYPNVGTHGYPADLQPQILWPVTTFNMPVAGPPSPSSVDFPMPLKGTTSISSQHKLCNQGDFLEYKDEDLYLSDDGAEATLPTAPVDIATVYVKVKWPEKELPQRWDSSLQGALQSWFSTDIVNELQMQCHVHSLQCLATKGYAEVKIKPSAALHVLLSLKSAKLRFEEQKQSVIVHFSRTAPASLTATQSPESVVGQVNVSPPKITTQMKVKAEVHVQEFSPQVQRDLMEKFKGYCSDGQTLSVTGTFEEVDMFYREICKAAGQVESGKNGTALNIGDLGQEEITCRVPLFQYNYLNQMHRKEMEQIERENSVTIQAEVSVSIRKWGTGSDLLSKAHQDFTDLLQKSMDNFSDVPPAHMYIPSEGHNLLGPTENTSGVLKALKGKARKKRSKKGGAREAAIVNEGGPAGEGGAAAEEETCPVCMDNFVNQEKLPAKLFCKECLNKSVGSLGAICPVCTVPIPHRCVSPAGHHLLGKTESTSGVQRRVGVETNVEATKVSGEVFADEYGGTDGTGEEGSRGGGGLGCGTTWGGGKGSRVSAMATEWGGGGSKGGDGIIGTWEGAGRGSREAARGNAGGAVGGAATEEENCPICMDYLVSKDKLFCPICPVCKKVFGKVEGNQPVGTIRTQMYKTSLPGFLGYGTIVIEYSIPSGIQSSEHPSPGKLYHGTLRTAYLPDNPEGKQVLELLKRAFDQKLIFTVGTSRTAGMDNCVIWNGILHKTNMHGGPTSFGYPDPDYLKRVRKELKAKGIQ